jgi:hypothetical protein
MRLVWRAVMVVAIFVAVGLLTTHVVMAGVHPGSEAEAEVRLTAWMAGLFAGGAAALLAGLAVLRRR